MVISNHFQGRDGSFHPFVAVLSAGSVQRLLHGVGGEDTEDDGASVFEGDIGDALRHRLADELEVARLSPSRGSFRLSLAVLVHYRLPESI